MAQITFYEKPGCGGNAKQKKLLRAAGHELDERNLLTEPWTPDSLRAFFGDMPLVDWFNPAAPRIKSGAVEPSKLSPDEALRMMVVDPLLIRRPLMISGDQRMAGFDADRVAAMFGLQLNEDVQTCRRSDGKGCPEPGQAESA